MKIYTSAPISGLSYEDVFNYYEKLAFTLKGYGYTILCPMTGKAYWHGEAPSTGYSHPVSTDHAITERDRWMTVNSDVVYCNLIGAKKVSIGCVAELAWAHDHGVHVVLAMEEGNIHNHAFIREFADVLFDNEKDCLYYLQSLIGSM